MSTIDTSAYQQKKGLTVKDLVTTGIFTAIMFVLFLAGGMFFGMNPAITFYTSFGPALLCGPIYLLLVAKVPKHGPVIIMGVLMGALLFAFGMHWAMNTVFMVLGVIADLIAGSRKFQSIWMNILSYMVFSLPPVFSFIAFFADTAG